MTKIFKAFIIGLIFSLIPIVKAFNVVSPTPEFYINDYADIIDKENEERVISKSKALYEQKDVQIVVLTINDLEGISIEDYANKFYNDNKIGSKENSGILILVSVNDRNIRIEVGDHLEGLIPDGKAGRFLDNYAIPYLKNNDWNGGIINLYNALYDEISSADLSAPQHKTDSVIPDSLIIAQVGFSVFLGILTNVYGFIFFLLFIALLVGEFIFLNYINFHAGFTIFLVFFGFIVYIFVTVFKSASLSSGRRGYNTSSYHSSKSSFTRGGGGHSSGGGASRHF
ncbi:MAG TPA: hypothetical protein DCE23_07895 [Firmicutes bacterium]|nr:hypothetical protein [Bacillota bacterium]